MPECEERLDGRQDRTVTGVEPAVGERPELATSDQPFEEVDRRAGLRRELGEGQGAHASAILGLLPRRPLELAGPIRPLVAGPRVVVGVERLLRRAGPPRGRGSG